MITFISMYLSFYVFIFVSVSTYLSLYNTYMHTHMYVNAYILACKHALLCGNTQACICMQACQEDFSHFWFHELPSGERAYG